MMKKKTGSAVATNVNLRRALKAVRAELASYQGE